MPDEERADRPARSLQKVAAKQIQLAINLQAANCKARGELQPINWRADCPIGACAEMRECAIELTIRFGQ